MKYSESQKASFGMWIFLATEVMFFGGLFVAYSQFSFLFPAEFAAGSNHMSITAGSFNTVVLLLSSLTMALAVGEAEEQRRARAVVLMVVTAALGAVFLGVKAWEYYEHYQAALVPGIRYNSADAPGQKLFMILYFVMTALHAAHLAIGIGLLLVLAVFITRSPNFGEDQEAVIDVTGLYWHFIDIIWIFLFPLLYLLGRR